MTYAEYKVKYPYNMVTYNDKYGFELEDLLDDLSYDWHCENDIPKYVFGTEIYTHEIDIEGAIENALEEAYEDAEFDNTNELIQFVDEWNKKNQIHSYAEANIVVFVPNDLREEYIRSFK